MYRKLGLLLSIDYSEIYQPQKNISSKSHYDLLRIIYFGLYYYG